MVLLRWSALQTAAFAWTTALKLHVHMSLNLLRDQMFSQNNSVSADPKGLFSIYCYEAQKLPCFYKNERFAAFAVAEQRFRFQNDEEKHRSENGRSVHSKTWTNEKLLPEDTFDMAADVMLRSVVVSDPFFEQQVTTGLLKAGVSESTHSASGYFSEDTFLSSSLEDTGTNTHTITYINSRPETVYPHTHTHTHTTVRCKECNMLNN